MQAQMSKSDLLNSLPAVTKYINNSIGQDVDDKATEILSLIAPRFAESDITSLYESLIEATALVGGYIASRSPGMPQHKGRDLAQQLEYKAFDYVYAHCRVMDGDE